MSAVLEAERLTKRYGERRGVEEVSLTVGPGEVFGFLGANGAGKTTVIRMMLDLIRPTSGRLRVLGEEPARAPGIRRRIGYLPGELVLEGRQRGASFLHFLAGVRGGVPRERIEGLAERLNVDLSVRLRDLSKGNKQKVGLIQAFMHEPSLLILDEPTSGLDPLVQQEFLAMVREARDAGQTVFMSSHVLAEVQHVAGRVGVLRQGRLVTVREVSALTERTLRKVEVRFEDEVPLTAFEEVPGVREASIADNVLHCAVEGSMDPLVKALAAFPVRDLVSERPDLEDSFLDYYEQHTETERGGSSAVSRDA
ncbi:ABC transporter ATP-binding protein [Streptomyces sp. AJS327]|uniref:ABC transporter ATP-binding protein n=1 Tax=Streptomyces sp. AJS327 TaxID=2545265 RepID=UPI001C60EB7A|nr:ABC transporter ATP-binding protein [Streptomyces sp. AJS327]